MKTQLKYSILLLLLAFVGNLRAQDLQTLSRRDIVGTARYVSMAGAMTAVGGDASALADNPAGLGVFHHMMLEVTLDVQGERTRLVERVQDKESLSRTRFIPTSATAVFSLPSFGSSHHNLSLGYKRSLQMARITPGFTNGMGFETELDGYNNIYHFTWAMNRADRFCFGIGLEVEHLSLSKFMKYWQTECNGYDIQTTNTFTRTGVGASAGLLLHPVQMLRIGASVHSPTYGRLNVRDYSRGDYYDITQKKYIEDKAFDNGTASYSTRTWSPMYVTAGIAFQCLHYGLLSFEYDYQWLRGMDAVHTFKTGIEGVIANHWFIHAGYAYQSPMVRSELPYSIDDPDRTDYDFRYARHSHYVGAGLGYQGHWIIVQLGYQYRLQQENIYPIAVREAYCATEAVQHRVCLTLGMNR